jgi:hypothetical protein
MTENIDLTKIQPRTRAGYIANLVYAGKKVRKEEALAAAKYFASEDCAADRGTTRLSYDEAGSLLEKAKFYDEAAHYYRRGVEQSFWGDRLNWIALKFFEKRRGNKEALELVLAKPHNFDIDTLAQLQIKNGLLEDAVETYARDHNYRNTTFKLAKKIGKDKAYEIGMRIYGQRNGCGDRDKWAINAARASGKWDFVLERFCRYYREPNASELARTIEANPYWPRDVKWELGILKEAGKIKELKHLSRMAIEYFISKNSPRDAAEIARVAGFRNEAAKMYLRASQLCESEKNYEDAAKLAAQGRDYGKACELYEKAGDYSQALKFARKLGDRDRIKVFRRLSM